MSTYKGPRVKFTVRLPVDIHAKIERMLYAHYSINDWIVDAIERKLNVIQEKTSCKEQAIRFAGYHPRLPLYCRDDPPNETVHFVIRPKYMELRIALDDHMDFRRWLFTSLEP